MNEAARGALVKIRGRSYPYWWQGVQWRLMDLLRRRDFAPQPEGKPHGDTPTGYRVLVLTRLDQEGLGPEWGAALSRRDFIEAMQDWVGRGNVLVHDSSAQRALPVEELARICRAERITDLVVLDVYALTEHPTAAAYTSTRLAAALRTLPCRRIVVLWDLLDPTMALSARLLTENSGITVVVPSCAAEAEVLGIKNAWGPCHDLFAGAYFPVPEFGCDPLLGRPFDLYLPPSDHPTRRALVDGFSRLTQDVPVVRAPTEAPGYRDYLLAISRCRSVVVINNIRENYLKRLPRRLRPLTSTTHAVGRNLETLAAGSLLLAQDSSALREYVEPDVDFVAWRTIEECAAKWMDLRQDPMAAQRIASSGRARLVELASERPTLRRLFPPSESPV